MPEISQDQLDRLLALAEKQGKTSPAKFDFRSIAVIALIGALIFSFVYKKPESPSPDDTPTPTPAVDGIEGALAKLSSNDKETLKLAATSLADFVKADGESNSPKLSKRSQVGEILPNAFSRALWAHWKDSYESSDLVKSIVLEQFDEDSEFPQTEGPLSDEDRQAAIDQLLFIATKAGE